MDEPVKPRAWAGLAVVAAASFVATLDTMVLYVAFGDIRRSFPDVSAASLSWILSGYTIVIAAGMVGAGRWADRLGRRRIFLAGMGLFTAASAICAVAPGAGSLIAGRVLQGFGAAALTPASLALILRGFRSPGCRRRSPSGAPRVRWPPRSARPSSTSWWKRGGGARCSS
jgi:MFS family permease